MDNRKMREEGRTETMQSPDGQSSSGRVMLSYLQARNQIASNKTRSPSQPERFSSPSGQAGLGSTWKSGLGTDRGGLMSAERDTEYIKFVEELLDRALKKDGQVKALEKKLR